jgi:hypothetical protein
LTLSGIEGPAVAIAAEPNISVTDAQGQMVPCEDMLAELRAAQKSATPAEATKAQVSELESKGIERCNADDDKRADGFFADALKLLRQ